MEQPRSPRHPAQRCRPAQQFRSALGPGLAQPRARTRRNGGATQEPRRCGRRSRPSLALPLALALILEPLLLPALLSAASAPGEAPPRSGAGGSPPAASAVAVCAAESPAGATPALLPCPLAAGWEVVGGGLLPRRDRRGRPIGGFSALRYDCGRDGLELLSDAPQGGLSRWRGLRGLLNTPGSQAGGTGMAGQKPCADLTGTGPAGCRLVPGDAVQRTPQARVGSRAEASSTDSTASIDSSALTDGGSLPLLGQAGEPLPQTIDAEGLERWQGRWWVASEGRRTAERPPLLLGFSPLGRLQELLALPPEWQPGPGRGLTSNRGPESLALLRRPEGGEGLLLAAERPLLQDPPDRVRLLEWRPVAAATVQRAARPADGAADGSGEGRQSLAPRALAPLALPTRGDWGLTELLPVAAGPAGIRLLALLRRFEPPDTWEIRLALYPLPPVLPAAAAGGGQPVAPLHSWRLAAGATGSEAGQAPGRGLPADNWEGLAVGPRLADGRSTLLLVSDDNFNPLQESRLAVLAPRRAPACGAAGP